MLNAFSLLIDSIIIIIIFLCLTVALVKFALDYNHLLKIGFHLIQHEVAYAAYEQGQEQIVEIQKRIEMKSISINDSRIISMTM